VFKVQPISLVLSASVDNYARVRFAALTIATILFDVNFVSLESQASLGVSRVDLLNRVDVRGGPQIEAEVVFHSGPHNSLKHTNARYWTNKTPVIIKNK